VPKSGCYGEEFGQRLHAQAKSFVCHTLRRGLMAVTEIKCDAPTHELSSSLTREDAFIVAVQLRDYPRHEYWEDGRQAKVTSLRAGDTNVYDIRRDPVFHINNPFHSVHFYLPRSGLNAIADDAQAAHVNELSYRPGVGHDDRTMRGLTQSLLPAFEHPEQANRLFVEHVTLAIGLHVASAYGGMKSEQRAAQGGLAPWQKRRALEVIEANLDGDVSALSLARACGLSASHFARAFRKSMGTTPHQWLLRLRVERAQEKLRDTDAPLTDIALACGFADQSHFTRVFSKLAGISPASWRRQVHT